jgi:HD-GYP domain-containing protein (c-di-GMP phosphodiesterase class II)
MSNPCFRACTSTACSGRGWHPFWRSSFLIDREDIAKLHASVVSRVVIDTARGLDVPTGTTDEPEDAPRQEPAPEAVDEAPPEEQTAPEIVDIGNEIAIALRIREDGRQFVKAMYAAIRQGRTPDTEPALPLIMAIRDSVTRNPHALTSVARVKPGEEYAHLHPVAVAALMAAFARRLGMPEEDVVIAALGGLFHDAGESHLPPTLLDKPGKLSGEEFDLMRGHRCKASARSSRRACAAAPCCRSSGTTTNATTAPATPTGLPAKPSRRWRAWPPSATSTTRWYPTGCIAPGLTRPRRSS